ncbi:MAG: diacylglycerol kinase family protein, partial [Myxococcota bacterium]|nr:diacylglycerol kinase family protein [Myxococcota bacterium]
MTLAPDFAVLLNPNAKRVSQSVCNRIGEIVHPDHVFMSESEDDASRVVDDILNRGYDTVFTGGGDGTVTQFINMLPEGDVNPRVGILRLGTGNAMAGIVSSGNPLVDLRTYASNPTSDAYHLSLCEAEGTRFAFAGLGLDAVILNDYRAMQRRFNGSFFESMLHNVGGYVASTFGVTVPRMLMRWLKRQKTQVRITNTGAPAYAIERTPQGGQVGTIYDTGAVLYEGPTNAVMFGTCPYYGYNIRMLPFAGLDEHRFHLRVSNVPTPALIGNVRGIWKGTIDHSQLSDFQVERVHVAFSDPMP